MRSLLFGVKLVNIRLKVETTQVAYENVFPVEIRLSPVTDHGKISFWFHQIEKSSAFRMVC